MKVPFAFSILSIIITLSSIVVRAQETTSTGASPAPSSSAVPTVCNGYSEFCNRPYSSIAFVATHNSYTDNIPDQLKAGVRAFLLDGHNNPTTTGGPIELCHTSCAILDAGTVANTLKNFTTFLEQNPNEVITIFWENYDDIDPLGYKTAYDTAGLTQYSYIPPSPTEWPTLGSLIQNNTRVINFIDRGANNVTVPWLLEEYKYVFETPFENYNLTSFTCTVDRPKNQSRPMYLINHFLYETIKIDNIDVDLPDAELANVTNGANLEQHVQLCQKTFGKIPNFLAVDFYQDGSDGVNVFTVAAELNVVTYTPPKSTNSTSSAKKSGAARLKGDLEISLMALIGMATFVILRL